MGEKSTKIWNRNFITILIVIFFHFMSVYLLLPIMPFYLTNHLKANNTQMAVILAGFTVLALIVCPFAGYMVDNFKRKPLLIIFNIFFIGVSLIYLIADNLWIFGFDRALNGASYSMVVVFGFTMVVNSVKREFKDSSMLYYGLVSKFGMAIAPAISIIMFVSGYGFRDIFILSAIFGVVGLVAVLFISQKRQYAMEAKVRSTFDKKIFLRVIPEVISVVLLTFTYGMINNYMATIAIKNVHYAVENIIFFALLAFGMGIFRWVAGNRIKRRHYTGVVAASAVSIAVCVVSIGVWDYEILLYVAAFIVGGCFELLTVTFRRIFIDMSPDDRVGIGASNYYMSWDLGVGIGVIAGGILSHHESFREIFEICAGLLILGALLFRIFVFKHFMKHIDRSNL